MNRFPMLVLLSLYTSTCTKLSDQNCPHLDHVLAPALYTGEPNAESGIQDFVLDVQTTDRAVMSWTDADGVHTATYTISIE